MSAGVPPQTPLKELAALLQTFLLDFCGPASKGRQRKGRKKGERKEKGREK